MTVQQRKTIVLVVFLLVGLSLTIPSVVTADSNAVHVIQRGETLGAIAKRYDVSLTRLTAANSISNPDKIYAGQRLIIPGAGNAAAITPSTSNGTLVHVVQRGETLFRISVQYNISMNSIVTANGIANPNSIYAGQQLVVSGSPAEAGVAAPSEPPVVAAQPVAQAGAGPGATISLGKQIVVDLSDSTTYAYENGQLLRSFVVSTGLPQTPTVQGDYRIYLKYDLQRMRGPGYDLPNVPWVMYFYQGYGFHGTYWHNNFGQPMSHGCVNMRTPEAEWLWGWAPMGTPVHVQA